MALLDKGGAEIARRIAQAKGSTYPEIPTQLLERSRERRARLEAQQVEEAPIGPPSPKLSAEPSVRVRTKEAHDGEACDCLPGDEIVLKVGDSVKLTHICHDGRVDVLTVEILGVDLPVEHGSVEVN